MRNALWLLLRTGVLLVVCLTGVAAMLGRTVSADRGEAGASPRVIAAAPAVFVGPHACTPGDPRTRWIDPSSGRLATLDLPSGDVLVHARCAPWQDADGESEVVGRWIHVRGEGQESTPAGVGLGRFAFPSGRALDRIPLNVLPTSAPCWFPDGSPRVLFPGGDGRLYRVDFNARPGARNARTVRWLTPPPASGQSFFLDVSWPTEANGGGYLIASMADSPVLARGASERAWTGERLWWLRLDPTGEGIIAAGPLVDLDGPAEWLSERFPTLLTRPDGTSWLAFLTRTKSEMHWRLALAPLRSGTTGGSPVLDQDQAVILADHLATTPPAVSPDGRFVTVMEARTDSLPARPVRVASQFPAAATTVMATVHHGEPAVR